jgi:hypothetical protein
MDLLIQLLFSRVHGSAEYLAAFSIGLSSNFASVVKWSELLLATDPEITGSVPGATRFCENWCVWNGVH